MVQTMATKKKRPSSEELKGLLLEGNFGAKNDAPLPLTDPVSTTQMVLKLDDIIPYDKNPRREKNPAYDDIKASIRSKKQLNNNFNVTRRPGDEKFMVESGGNTRLQILKELYHETGDEAFNTVHCLFVPWKSEAAVLSAHLIENEMRGDMTLIDKAYAVQTLREELEAEQTKKLSDIGFTRVASEIGYRLSPKLLRRFQYAIKLDQMIPQVLKKGLGGSKIDHIKKVEKAYADFCQDKTDQFDAIFIEVMSESDDGEEFWNFDDVRRELDERLAEATGIKENLLRLEVDAILFDRPGEIDFGATPPEAPAKEVNRPIEKDNSSRRESSEHSETSVTDAVTPEAITDEYSVHYDEAFDKQDLSQIVDPVTTEKQTESVTKAPRIHFFREKNYSLAMKIGQNAGFNTDCIMPVKWGMGFYLERPDEQLIDIGFSEVEQVNIPIHTPKSLVWWMLLSATQQLYRGVSTWEHTQLYQDMLYFQQNNELSQEFGVLVGQVPNVLDKFLHNSDISDVLFTDIFRLIENCRAIQKLFTEQEIWNEHIEDGENMQ
jgi:ParB family protein of integrating conjugative element (PFGI_1 class)